MGFAALKKFVQDQEMEEQQQTNISPAQEKMIYECPKTFNIFWKWIGAPMKGSTRMPLLPYQKLLTQIFREHKAVWIKKSRGLGVSTYMLYHTAHRSMTEFRPGDRVIFVTGARINLAEDLILRLKRLFLERFPDVYAELMQQPSTIARIAGVTVEAMPSHLASLRGYDRVRLIVADEVDYFQPAQQKELRATIEGFIGKINSDPTICLISTPFAPGGIMQTIEQEKDSLYYKCFFDYRYGLEGDFPIYSQEQLDRARQSPDWAREYEGAYIGRQGNVWSAHSIERATINGSKYEAMVSDPSQWMKDVPTVMALDPAWGSTSKYGVIILQFIDQKIVVLYAAEYSNPDMSEMISELWKLYRQCGHVTNIMVDQNNPEVIGTIRREFRKDNNYSAQGIKDVIANCRKYGTPIETRLFVVPKNFAIEGKQMLQHAVMLMDDPDGLVAIPEKHKELLLALRSATATEWKLDKSSGESLHTDLTDAFIMACSYFRMAK